MKKYALSAAVLLLCSMLTACSSETAADSKGQSSSLISDEVTKVDITHILAGQFTEWSIEGDDMEAEDKWYAVSNPSDPADALDFSDEALKDKLIYGAAYDPNADDSERAVTGEGRPLIKKYSTDE